MDCAAILRMHQHDQGAGRDQADRGEILARIVTGVGVERRVDRERAGAAEDQRVAVRCTPRHGPRGDRAAGAAAVLDDDLLAQRLAHFVGDDTGHGIVAASRGVGDHQHDGTVRVVLRVREWRSQEPCDASQHQLPREPHRAPSLIIAPSLPASGRPRQRAYSRAAKSILRLTSGSICGSPTARNDRRCRPLPMRGCLCKSEH